MSFIGNIDNIPVFTTIQGALDWGAQYNILGYHTHNLNGVTVYMSGNTHADIQAANINLNNNTTTNQTIRYSSVISTSGY